MKPKEYQVASHKKRKKIIWMPNEEHNEQIDAISEFTTILLRGS